MGTVQDLRWKENSSASKSLLHCGQGNWSSERSGSGDKREKLILIYIRRVLMKGKFKFTTLKGFSCLRWLRIAWLVLRAFGFCWRYLVWLRWYCRGLSSCKWRLWVRLWGYSSKVFLCIYMKRSGCLSKRTLGLFERGWIEELRGGLLGNGINSSWLLSVGAAWRKLVRLG